MLTSTRDGINYSAGKGTSWAKGANEDRMHVPRVEEEHREDHCCLSVLAMAGPA